VKKATSSSLQAASAYGLKLNNQSTINIQQSTINNNNKKATIKQKL
jgi:hypothetical protein